MKLNELPKAISFWTKVWTVYKIMVIGFFLIFILEAINSIIIKNYIRLTDVLLTLILRLAIIMVIALGLAATYVFLIDTAKRSQSITQRPDPKIQLGQTKFKSFQLIIDAKGQKFKKCLTCDAQSKIQRNKCRNCGSWIKM